MDADKIEIRLRLVVDSDSQRLNNALTFSMHTGEYIGPPIANALKDISSDVETRFSHNYPQAIIVTGNAHLSADEQALAAQLLNRIEGRLRLAVREQQEAAGFGR